MHLYILARGVKREQDKFIADLAARNYPYKYAKDKPPGMIELAVRPIQLYEIVFPEEHLEEVVRTINPSGYEKYKFYRGLIDFFRRILGLRPVPQYVPDGKFRMHNPWTAVHAIGIKKDEFKNGIEQL